MSGPMLAEMVRFRGYGGDRIEAYAARPLVPGSSGGVVVIHHMPGFDEATKDVVTAFQRHFRPVRVDGVVDVSTTATLKALLAARDARLASIQPS